jgi:hypothetical protein
MFPQSFQEKTFRACSLPQIRQIKQVPLACHNPSAACIKNDLGWIGLIGVVYRHVVDPNKLFSNGVLQDVEQFTNSKSL